MSDGFFTNAKKPRSGIGGKLFLNMMNKGHAKLSDWGLELVEINRDFNILDIGCGGGRNLSVFLKKTDGKVIGLDYSKASVEKSKELNKDFLGKNLEVYEGKVEDLNLDKDYFDLVTAFETIYFWSDIVNTFKKIKDVLKKDGKFLIVNEVSKGGDNNYWAQKIDMNVYTLDEIENLLIEAGFKILKKKEGKKENIAILAINN